MSFNMEKIEGKNWTLYEGNMLDVLPEISGVDSIVTDPPYELNFMHKGWDNSGIAFQVETWKKCYDALKPGGYLLAFGGSRTFHRIACAIEDAGFEIRDTIMWLYGSGFPKSMNIGKAVESKLLTGSANTQEFKNLKGTKEKSGNWGINKNAYEYGARPSDYSTDGHERVVEVDYQTEEGQKWNGWGTALKPSYEPVIVARKPCEGSCIDNVLKYGVGGINIDECRVENTTEDLGRNNHVKSYGGVTINESNTPPLDQRGRIEGRFPANTILTYDETDYEEVCGGMPYTKSNGGVITHKDFSKHKGSMMHYTTQEGDAGRYENGYISPNDSGTAARYFYCAKASKRDRDEGCEGLEYKMFHRANGGGGLEDTLKFKPVPRKNTHPTVKPTSLMQYLIRLVTPKGGTILDPFNGSGSTGKAAMYENKDRNADYKYIGIELTPEYIPISIARMEYVAGKKEEKIKEIPTNTQMSIFDFLA